MLPSFGFIIQCHVVNAATMAMLRNTVQKIRNFHDEPIVLVDNQSTVDLSTLTSEHPKVTVEAAVASNMGEMNAYLSFLRGHHQFDTAVILQDSFQINCKLVGIENVDTIRFLYHFINHHRWHLSLEPQNEYNVSKGIKTHDDLVPHLLSLHRNDAFRRFALNLYADKRRWVGCFGSVSIITHAFLTELEEKTGLLAFAAEFVKDKRDRVALESILPIACLYLVPLAVCVNSYAGAFKTHNAPIFTKHLLLRP